MVVADEPLKRSECNGWRFSGGILFFGGRHDDGATSNNAVLLDNDFTNQGELKAGVKQVEKTLNYHLGPAFSIPNAPIR